MPILPKNDLATLDYLKSTQSTISSLCLPLKSYGIKFFTYSRIYEDRHAVFLCNSNEWYELKFKNDLFEKDGFITLTSLNNNKYTRSLFTGAPQDKIKILPYLFEMNFWNSIDLYKCQIEYIEVFHFASDRENTEIVNFYLNNFDLLEEFADDFHNKISSSIEKAPNELYISIKPGNSKDIKDLTTKDKNVQSANKLNKYNIMFKGQVISLSPRQRQCMLLNARGKTAKEIARELNISNRTIEGYFEALRIKFNCLNRRDLVSIMLDNHIKIV